MAPKVTQDTRDELLIENAILKYNEKVRDMLKEELKPIYMSFDAQNSKIEHMDRRVGKLEADVKDIKDVIEPLAKFKRQMWLFFIGAMLLVAMMDTDVLAIISNWIGKGN